MSTTTRKRPELSRRIPAKLEEIDTLCAEVAAFLHEHGLDRRRFDMILLAREALTNAVIHGCRRDATLWALFSLSLEEGQWVITVEDPGPGFDWRARMDSPVQASDETGRGLSIFRCYATEFSYNPQGNQVTLRKTVTKEETLS